MWRCRVPCPPFVRAVTAMPRPGRPRRHCWCRCRAVPRGAGRGRSAGRQGPGSVVGVPGRRSAKRVVIEHIQATQRERRQEEPGHQYPAAGTPGPLSGNMRGLPRQLPPGPVPRWHHTTSYRLAGATVRGTPGFPPTARQYVPDALESPALAMYPPGIVPMPAPGSRPIARCHRYARPSLDRAGQSYAQHPRRILPARRVRQRARAPASGMRYP